MIRKIVNINKDKCNGCGICVHACHENAIEIIDGKAVLVSDEYCDGLGDCLKCPEDAIEIIERDAKEYDEEAVKIRQESSKKVHHGGCPGSMAKKIERKVNEAKEVKEVSDIKVRSELNQWPIQLKLVATNASYFENADILVAADCTAFSYGNFHRDFIKGKIVLIGCPKLDDNDFYKEKLTEIFKNNNIKSITVLRMEVPCCFGIVSSVKNAMIKSEKIVKYEEIIIGIDGSIKS